MRAVSSNGLRHVTTHSTERVCVSRSRRSMHSTRKVSPIVTLEQARIYRDHPNSSKEPPLFPCIDFSISSAASSKERWAVISHESSIVKTRFLQCLQGQFICVPPTARSWPHLLSSKYLESHSNQATQPNRAIRYVGFANSNTGQGNSGTQGSYLSARYENRREESDWSLRDYLRGTVSFNLSDEEIAKAYALEKTEIFRRVTADLNLDALLGLPVSNLSNGQTRRARIAKALVHDPALLLLDDPFAGLDPSNATILSSILSGLADDSRPRLVLALQASEAIPHWITHIIEFDRAGNVTAKGLVDDILPQRKALGSEDDKNNGLTKKRKSQPRLHGKLRLSKSLQPLERMGLLELARREAARKLYPGFDFWDTYEHDLSTRDVNSREPLIEMSGVKVKYGDKCVLGNWQQEKDGQIQEGLYWDIRRGDRWGIFGANGSGKTTIISLLTSDHPQAYALPIKFFGRSRLPTPSQPGVSVFDIQNRIGHSSPEVHTYFPKGLTIRQVIESAWAETFQSRPTLTYARDEQISAALRWFQRELDPRMDPESDPVTFLFGTASRPEDSQTTQLGPWFPNKIHDWAKEDPLWADEITLGQSGLSAQKVALFLRAVIKKPDIVVLDEAFSGMSEAARKKCMLWLAHGEQMWPAFPEWMLKGYGRVTPFRKLPTPMEGLGYLRNTGLEERQALVCVSHRQEEVPFVVNKWLRLPEPNEGKSVRFGSVLPDQPGEWWHTVWEELPPTKIDKEPWIDADTMNVFRKARAKANYGWAMVGSEKVPIKMRKAAEARLQKETGSTE